MSSLIKEIQIALQELAIPEKAEFFPKFFKTGTGEYGEGDIFIGVKVPDQRTVAKEYYSEISLNELGILISSKIHEHRLTALLILILKFDKADSIAEKEKTVDFYLANLQYINNWDLVDTSCYKILGKYAFEHQKDEILRKLSSSENMWHKRIAVVGTMFYIKKGFFDLTKEFVTQNLLHSHDLMHKANGWMLREMGNKNDEELINFLNLNYRIMPRTSLRYAIEKLDEISRQNYLKGRI